MSDSIGFSGEILADKLTSDIIALSRKILHCANKGLTRKEFMTEALRMLIEFCGCDAIELRTIEHGRLWRSEVLKDGKLSFSLLISDSKHDKIGNIIPSLNIKSDLESLYEDIYCGRYDSSLPYFTASGIFFTGDADIPLELSSENCKWAGGRSINLDCGYKSFAIIPLETENVVRGLIIPKSNQQNFFNPAKVGLLGDIAQILGIAYTHRRAQVALRERVKELTCLYGIARVAAKPGISQESILSETVKLLPPGWLYPKVATGRILLDGRSYVTDGFGENLQRLSADITVDGKKRGVVEVAYTEEMPQLDEGPFLKEERSLIDAIAREIAIIIERRHIEEEKKALQEQLRHADRLATIGQLAAGVAHELNEPLGSILGFAQLAKKSFDQPEQAAKDIDKIEAASLHAREVIKKLMLFARQTPQKMDMINLSEVVEEGLYFLESRCAKAGIKLIKDINTELPRIKADKSQLYQVLVNLVVNSIQAMPDGGTITINTAQDEGGISLSVSDTGTGIDEDILEKIFVPFFTTKDINEGTGLGLAVVHGIVSSHKGEISVKSKPGKGARFTVRLPIPDSSESGTEEEDGQINK